MSRGLALLFAAGPLWAQGEPATLQRPRLAVERSADEAVDGFGRAASVLRDRDRLGVGPLGGFLDLFLMLGVFLHLAADRHHSRKHFIS